MADYFGETQSLIRKVSHHPFEFLYEKMQDEDDHSPVRLRYLGVFYPKGAWRKKMRRASEKAPPVDTYIFARVLAFWRGRKRYFLQQGIIRGDTFYNDHGDKHPISDIQYWKEMKPHEIEEYPGLKEL